MRTEQYHFRNYEVVESPAGSYSVAMEAGGLVFLAGQTPRDRDNVRHGDKPFAVQARMALDNLEAAANAAGLSLKDSKELFYHALGGVETGAYGDTLTIRGPIYSVTVTATGGSLETSVPREVIRTIALRIPHPGGGYHTYEVSADGQKFLVPQHVVDNATPQANQVLPDHPAPGLMVAINWAQRLKK